MRAGGCLNFAANTNIGKRLPRKVWLLLALALVLALWPLAGPWLGLTDPQSPRDAFLDAVAADWARDPRLSVVRVDHRTGQIVVRVKSTGATLFFVLTRMEPKTMPDGQVLQHWEAEYQDESGTVMAFGRGSGTQTSAIHVDVPGLR